MFVILVIILISILIPKSCGSFGGMSTTIPQQLGGSKCECLGYSYEDRSGAPLDIGVIIYCIGICHSCQARYP